MNTQRGNGANPQGGKPEDNKKQKRPGYGLFQHISIAIVVLLLINGVYVMLVGNELASGTISISQVAQDVNAGKVTKITVSGDDLRIEYATSSATSTMIWGATLAQTLKPASIMS